VQTPGDSANSRLVEPDVTEQELLVTAVEVGGLPGRGQMPAVTGHDPEFTQDVGFAARLAHQVEQVLEFHLGILACLGSVLETNLKLVQVFDPAALSLSPAHEDVPSSDASDVRRSNNEFVSVDFHKCLLSMSWPELSINKKRGQGTPPI